MADLQYVPPSNEGSSNLARKSPQTSNGRSASKNSGSGKRKVHPKRTGIVWSVFLGAMTFAGGALLLGDDWRVLPAVNVATAESGRATMPASGRWQAIVVHHSGTAAGTAEDISRQHREWGFPSLGYHFVIGNGNGEQDGVVIHGPRWSTQEGGAHVADRAPGATPDAAWFNQNAIGICLIGNGERRPFTDAQVEALVALVNDLQRACGIPDSAVFMHSDLVEVASPGRWFPRSQFDLRITN